MFVITVCLGHFTKHPPQLYLRHLMPKEHTGFIKRRQLKTCLNPFRADVIFYMNFYNFALSKLKSIIHKI